MLNRRRSDRLHPLTRLFCSLAGVRIDAQRAVPKGLGSAVATGVLLVLISIIAAANCGYAVARAYAGHPYAIPLALLLAPLWGGVVLSIDRLIVMGIKKSAPLMHQLGHGVLRLPLAMALGLTISKPALLQVSSPVLDLELRRQQRHAIEAEVTANAAAEDLANKHATGDTTEAKLSDLQTRLRNGPDTYEYEAAVASLASADEVLRRVIAANGPELRRIRESIVMLGTPVTEGDSVRVVALRSRASRLEGEIGSARRAQAAAAQYLGEVSDAWFVEMRGAKAKLDTTVVAARSAAADAEQNTEVRNQESESALGSLMRTNLINQYTILKQIENDPANPNHHTLRRFEYGFDFLFILLEIIPMLIKLLAPMTPADRAIDAIEFVETQRLNSRANREHGEITLQDDVLQATHAAAWEAMKQAYLVRIAVANGDPTTINIILEEFRTRVA